LAEGKLVYMAVPRLAEDKPFYPLDPTKLSVPTEESAEREVAARIGPKVGVDEMKPVDLIVCGSSLG
jgi:5-formyltetrahydrofolate cyclo-ligase